MTPDATEKRSGKRNPGGAQASRTSAGSAVVVFEPFDVVFAEVLAVLHLDEHEQVVAGVRHAMRRPARDVDRPPRLEPVRPAVERDLSGAGDDDPVLSPPAVALIAQAPTRIDL